MLCLYLKDHWYFSVNDVRRKKKSDSIYPVKKEHFSGVRKSEIKIV